MYLVAVSADEDRFLRFLFKKFCARVMLFFQTIERTRAPAQKSACCIEQEGQPDWQLPVMRERERKRVRVCMHMTVVLPVSFRYRSIQTSTTSELFMAFLPQQTEKHNSNSYITAFTHNSGDSRIAVPN